MTPSAGKNAVVNLLAKVLDGELHQRDAPSVKRDAPPADPTLYKRLAAVEARLEVLRPYRPLLGRWPRGRSPAR
jgi:hypothetical protein